MIIDHRRAGLPADDPSVPLQPVRVQSQRCGLGVDRLANPGLRPEA